MKNVRIIGRIDVKNEYAIKGIQLEGLRKVGIPNEMALEYYADCVDELVFMDAVAAYYDRNNLFDIVKNACSDIFVPITIGGGIRNLSDVQTALNSGADKVAINSAAIHNPDFLYKAARVYGSQCIVLSVDAKRKNSGSWEAYTDNGREASGMEVVDWVKQAQELGVGEILLTSIDNDGTKKGFDLELAKMVSSAISIPFTISGGAGSLKHIKDLLQYTSIDGVCFASMLHYKLATVSEIKRAALSAGYKVRT